jgi:hypothetical protein
MQKKLVLMVFLSVCLLVGSGCSTPRGVWAEVDDVYATASDRAEDAARREPSTTSSTNNSGTNNSGSADPSAPQPDPGAPTRSGTRQPSPGRNTAGNRALTYFLSGVLQILVSLALLVLLYL